jgi:hypothetical protein
MSFSDELKGISYTNSRSIDKIRAKLLCAAMKGEVYVIVKFDDLDILAVESYLKSQGFLFDTNLETEELYITWA